MYCKCISELTTKQLAKLGLKRFQEHRTIHLHTDMFYRCVVIRHAYTHTHLHTHIHPHRYIYTHVHIYVHHIHKCLHTLYKHTNTYKLWNLILIITIIYIYYDKICPDVQRNQMQYLIIQLHTYILQFIYIHTYTS